jgi:formylglycine-generating enzyme required for sulfatase activity
MKTQMPKRELGKPIPAVEAVVDPSRGPERGRDTYWALLATGMDPFGAIEPAAQGDQAVAAHLWLEALRLVEVPAGAFKMGSPEGDAYRWDDEGPQHEVAIPRPFLMGAFQVSQGCWEALPGTLCFRSWGDPALPVEEVSWNDICGPDGFLDRLNAMTEGARPEGAAFRLPSEAEWEYACRAGSTTDYGFGDDPAALVDYGWFDDNADGEPHPVGRKRPNAWGLHDLHGNVWEWCADAWHDDYRGAPKDGSAWLTDGDQARRVLRGGGWDLHAKFARSACRRRLGMGLRDPGIGFRVVLAAAGHGDPV